MNLIGFSIGMLDDNGYPEQELIDRIERWSVADDIFTLMNFVQPLFEEYGRCEYDSNRRVWVVVTGGWSGCEDVIMSLQKNHLFWSLCWMLSKRGGYYEFKGNSPTGEVCEG